MISCSVSSTFGNGIISKTADQSELCLVGIVIYTGHIYSALARIITGSKTPRRGI